MNIRKVAIRARLILIGLPIVLVLILFGFFYSVFYLPNWTTATTGTIIISGQKRKYLLYVPKGYDRAKPAPLVITLHTSMSWDSFAMAISQWNLVADENGFIVVYPQGTGFGPKSWEMTGSETPSRMPDVIFISQLIDKLEASYNIDKTGSTQTGCRTAEAWRSCCRAHCPIGLRRSGWFRLGSTRGGTGAQTIDRCR